MFTKKEIVTLICISTALAGCQALVPIHSLDKVGINQMLQAAEVEIVDNSEERQGTYLGSVEGYSCQNQATESIPSKAGAIDQLRISAVRLDATYVTNLNCEEGGVSLIKNCWQSWSCTAEAHKD